jgi:hypothetical protein
MKKILLIIPILLLAAFAQAQQVSAVPANFTAEDEVKLIVNVRGTNVEGVEPLYIWTWRPSDPVGGNGEWTNSNERLRMTKEADNVWSLTFVPTELYGRSPGEFAANGNEIHFLVKGRDGSGTPERKTDDLRISVQPLEFVPSLNRNFPVKVTAEDVITIYLDQKQADDPNLRFHLGDFSLTVSPVNMAGQAVDAKVETFDTSNHGNGVHSGVLIPTRSFAASARRAVGIKYFFTSKGDPGIRSPEVTILFVEQ